MNHNLRDENLKEYYESRGPSPDLAERLKAEAVEAGRRTSLADTERRCVAANWRKWSVAASFALVLTATAFVFFEQRSDNSVVDRVVGSPPMRPLTEPVEPADRAFDADHRLVAVKVYSDFCPRCPIISPVFDRLAEKYEQEPVIFVTMDLTTPATRRESVRLARELNIEWISEPPYALGMIKVVDRESHRLLSVLTDVSQQAGLESTLMAELSGSQ